MAHALGKPFDIKAYRKEKADEIREQRREYRNRERNAIRANQRAYLAANRERINARARERYRLSRLREKTAADRRPPSATAGHVTARGLWHPLGQVWGG